MRGCSMMAAAAAILGIAGCDAIFGPSGNPPDFIPANFPVPTGVEVAGGLGDVAGDTFQPQTINGRQFVVFEAEHFLKMDGGFAVESEVGDASGGEYLRRDPNGGFAGLGGPAVEYKVKFSHEGTWICWVRGYTEHADDNGIFLVAENGDLQAVQWCFATGNWHHSSSLRTESEHCGIRGLVTYEVVSNGPGDDLTRVIQFRARDAGFRMDRALFVDTPIYIPLGIGPPESDRQ